MQDDCIKHCDGCCPLSMLYPKHFTRATAGKGNQRASEIACFDWPFEEIMECYTYSAVSARLGRSLKT